MKGVLSRLVLVFLLASARGPLVAQSVSPSAVRGVVASPEGIAQRIPLGEFDVRVEADLINVLNLLNDDWGQLRVTPSPVALLEATERAPNGDLLARWGGGVLPLRTPDGQLQAADPWVTSTPASQWQAQLGFRVQWR